MNGGWVNHAGGDFWGFGAGCAGESAHYIGVHYHRLCCSKPSYEKQGFCRYVFLEDHIQGEIQNKELTIQGRVTVGGHPHVYSLTGLGYETPRFSVHQIGLACS